jgi:synaptotagmin-like protein
MISGEVLIGIYLGKKKTLNIVVNEARDLAPAERNGSSNPYVKTYLLPDENKMSKRKTSIKKKTLNPVFNETLTYKIHDRPVISNCTVWLSVWNNDILGRNDFLGEVYISLSTLNLNNKSQKWYTLQDKQ